MSAKSRGITTDCIKSTTDTPAKPARRGAAKKGKEEPGTRTPDIKTAFVAALLECGTYEGAVARTSATPGLVYSLLSSDTDFRSAVEAALNDRLENAAITRALKGDVRVLLFLLERRLPQRYGGGNAGPQETSCPQILFVPVNRPGQKTADSAPGPAASPAAAQATEPDNA